MEVHPHSHSEKKKWHHYFWEFFMLFLAVFCGFLAENQREHYIEKHRAKEFAIALYNDIKNDTTDLNRILIWQSNKINHIDSLLQLLLKPGKWNDTAFSIHLATTIFVDRFFQNTGTYEQMKNSGSLRYFKQDIVTILQQYESTLSEIRLREEAESFKLEQRIIPFVEEAINIEFLYDLLLNRPLPKLIYVNLDDIHRQRVLTNQVIEIKMIGLRKMMLYNQLKNIGIDLLELLKKGYDVKK